VLNTLLAFFLISNISYANSCKELVSSSSSNVISFGTKFSDIDVLVRRLNDFKSFWDSREHPLFEKDMSIGSQSKKNQILNLIRELLLNDDLQQRFTQDEISFFENSALKIITPVRDLFYLPRGDTSQLKFDQWAELLVFYELRRVSTPFDRIILRQLKAGLNKFFKGRGLHNRLTYERLIQDIENVNQSLN